MTLDDFRTYVRQRLTISTAETATTTQIDTAVNQARYRLNAKYALLVGTALLDFTADTETVTLPTDLVEALSIHTADYVLRPINPQEWAEVAGLDVQAGPQVYVVDGAGGTMRVAPVPATTATGAATLRYVKRPTALSAGTDAPAELPAEFHDLIGEHAVYRIALNEEDLDLARAAWRVIYGDPGNPDDLGLDGELRAFVNKRSGPTPSRIALRGFRR